MPERETGPQLRLLQGGLDAWIKIGCFRIRVVKTRPTNFNEEVEVIEDDTFRVLSAPLEIQDVSDHPIRLMTGLMNVKPLTPGQLLLSSITCPAQVVAVVYDSNHEQLTKRPWLERAWNGLWVMASQKQWSMISTPLLGAKHARLDICITTNAFLESLSKVVRDSSMKVLLQVPEDSDQEVRERLRAHNGEAIT